MMKKLLVAAAILGILLFAGRWMAAPSQPLQTSQPNFVFILIDDLGYADFTDSATTTPNLDALISESIRFSRFYTSPVCTPTRASIMSSVNPARFNLTVAGPDWARRGLPGKLTLSLPEALKPLGYASHHYGKWHIGHHYRDDKPISGHDFRSALVMLGNGADHLNPLASINQGPEETLEGYKAAIIADYVTNFLASDEARKPFFLNVWFNAVHTLHTPPPSWAARYPNTPLGRYYAMVSYLDEQIGRIMTALRATGLSDNTIVMLTSDNGGSSTNPDSNRPFRGFKSDVLEGGIRLPLFVRWPGKFQNASNNDSMLLAQDILPTLVEAAGGVPPTAIEGESFYPLIEDRDRTKTRRRATHWLKKISIAFSAQNDSAYKFAVIDRDPDRDTDSVWKLLLNNLDVGLELYDLTVDPNEAKNLIDVNLSIKQRLLDSLLDFKLNQLTVPLEAKRLPPGVTRNRDTYEFSSPATVVMKLDRRTDSFDGDFTFSATVTPAAIGTGQIIAQKRGSWTLQIRPNGRLNLRVHDGKKRAVLDLTSDLQLEANQSYQLAFTIYAIKNSRDVIRLWARKSKDTGPFVVEAEDLAQTIERVRIPSPLTSIRLSDTKRPFIGSLVKPELRQIALNVHEFGVLFGVVPR